MPAWRNRLGVRVQTTPRPHPNFSAKHHGGGNGPIFIASINFFLEWPTCHSVPVSRPPEADILFGHKRTAAGTSVYVSPRHGEAGAQPPGTALPGAPHPVCAHVQEGQKVELSGVPLSHFLLFFLKVFKITFIS